MKLIKRILLVSVLLIISLIILFIFSYTFLSIHKPIESKNLLVESWLIGLGIENLVEEYHLNDLENIYVVGNDHSLVSDKDYSLSHYKAEEFLTWKKQNGALLLTNSTLLIDLKKLKLSDSIQSIAVKACDTRQNRVQAHFLLSIDGEFLGDDFVTDSLKDYSFSIDPQITNPQLLAICYDNDCYIDGENRNLFIKSIVINDLEFKILENFCLITSEENKITTGFNSQADETARYINSFLNSKIEIELITFDPVERNQTLAASIATSDYFNNKEMGDLNITSSGMHSRRSMVTYRKVLGSHIKIGVINAEASIFNKSNWYKSHEGRWTMLNEFLSHIVNWIELTFN